MPKSTLNNYLVPASGAPHGFQIAQVFSATPAPFDFSMLELDGEPFVPSGVYIDNSAGVGDLTIFVNAIQYTVLCPAGGRMAAQYPSPLDQSVTITGNGQATVVFVDYPVLPFNQSAGGGLGNVGIANGGDIAQGNTADAAVTNPASAATVIALLKGILSKEGSSPSLPFGAVPVSAVVTTTNAVANASLPATVGKTTYCTHLHISGLSPTAAGTSNSGFAGTVAALSYYINLPAQAQALAIPPIDVVFNPPIPASAQNIAILFSLSAFGAGSGAQSVTLLGFQL